MTWGLSPLSLMKSTDYTQIQHKDNAVALELNPKDFAERLNHLLDEAGAPELIRKRAEVLADLVNLPNFSKFDAESLLAGRILPRRELVEKLAAELDVDPSELTGKQSGPTLR